MSSARYRDSIDTSGKLEPEHCLFAVHECLFAGCKVEPSHADEAVKVKLMCPVGIDVKTVQPMSERQSIVQPKRFDV